MTESALNTQSIGLRYINYVDCDLWTSSYLHNCSSSIYWTFVVTGCTFCEFQPNSTVTLPNWSLETLMFTVENYSIRRKLFCNNLIDAVTNVILYYHLLGNSISRTWKLKIQNQNDITFKKILSLWYLQIPIRHTSNPTVLLDYTS